MHRSVIGQLKPNYAKADGSFARLRCVCLPSLSGHYYVLLESSFPAEEEEEEPGGLMGALPPFLLRSIVKDKQFKKVKSSLAGLGLNTVCEEAKCPNVGEVASSSSSSSHNPISPIIIT